MREFDKFVENVAGNVAVRVVMTDASGGDLVKLEDTAHSTGDQGVQMLAVRNDTLAALAGTDGDYAPLQVNATGAIYTALSAGGPIHVDDAAFTVGTSELTGVGMLADETAPDSVDEGDIGIPRMTLDRKPYTASIQSHDDAVTAYASVQGAEAKDFDGTDLPNEVAEGDVVRLAASRRGVQYMMPTDENGGSTYFADHDQILGAGGRDGVALMGGEAKDFDGSSLPNNVAEGDAIRLATSRYGVLYVMNVNEDGSESYIATEDEMLTGMENGAVNMIGAHAKDFDGSALPDAVNNEGDATRIAATLSGVQYVMSVNEDGSAQPAYDTVTDSMKSFEVNPISEHHSEETLVNVTNETDGTNNYYVDMDGFTRMGLQLEISGGSGTMTVTLAGTLQDDGTAAASCTYQDISADFGAASWTADAILQGKDLMYKYIRLQSVSSTGGANDADLTAYSKKAF
jgi:hypothetical protein|tara:strand:+ start:11269 stop:12642 length:1374 start_codon:yes stop_codon:yes gene_type:complete